MKFFIPVLIIPLIILACNNYQAGNNKQETVSAADQQQLPDSVKSQIDSIVYKLAAANKCRMTLKVAGDSTAAYYSGFDGRTNKVITDLTGTIDIGSCTKMFTATSILQLIEQHKLSLQDKLTGILPNDTLYKGLLVLNGKDYIDSVKIINLLQHSSGFPEYFVEGDDAKELKLHGDSTLRFTPYDLIKLAKKTNKPEFIPGTKFKYCNVNYILLGLIIEKLSGQTYQQYIQQHIFDPLGLKHSFFASINPPANRAPGHFNGPVSQMPATIAGAAGEIISDLDDMHTFIHAWNKGKLFSDPATIVSIKKDNYLDMSPGLITYGMGIINMLDKTWGHGGQTFGFQSFMGTMNNKYTFVFGIDDAAVSSWEPAIILTGLLSEHQ